MFMLLPIDMINGFLLHKNINLILSFSQIHKLAILGLLFLTFLTNIKQLVLVTTLVTLLILPSLIQVLITFKISFIFVDILKIMRYLTPVFSFMFFARLIKSKKSNVTPTLFKLINFSFIVFAVNILLKYVGLGYPMYPFNNIGSKGFFFAGNETSVVLIILSSVIGYKLLQQGEIKKYRFFSLFAIFLGITISSKTGLLGVILVMLLLPLKPITFTIRLKTLKFFILFLFLILLFMILLLNTSIVTNSSIFLRIKYFWNKLDFITFVLSNRNTFFNEALDVYSKKYNLIEKLFGVGQYKYELLLQNYSSSYNSIVEIDIADIFFAYGFVGLSLFLSLLGFVWFQAKKFKKSNSYPFASLVALLVLVLFGISSIAGHVFSSGMAAVFIGLLFSLMYIKKEQIENE